MTNQQETPLKWFLRRASVELFMVGFTAWIFLFLLENLKQGIVSNYLSLPHAALLLAGLGLLAVWFSPQTQEPALKPSWSKKELFWMTLFSLGIMILLPLITDLSGLMTLLLVVVTVAALWAVTFVMKEGEKL